MKMAGTVTEVDADARTITIGQWLDSQIVAGDFLFAAEPGEHIAYRRVPTGGWHVSYLELAIYALVLFGSGLLVGFALSRVL